MQTPVIPKTVEEVNALSVEEICRIWRFAPPGTLQQGDPVSDRIVERFHTDAKMTPEISKKLGW